MATPCLTSDDCYCLRVGKCGPHRKQKSSDSETQDSFFTMWSCWSQDQDLDVTLISGI